MSMNTPAEKLENQQPSASITALPELEQYGIGTLNTASDESLLHFIGALANAADDAKFDLSTPTLEALKAALHAANPQSQDAATATYATRQWVQNRLNLLQESTIAQPNYSLKQEIAALEVEPRFMHAPTLAITTPKPPEKDISIAG